MTNYLPVAENRLIDVVEDKLIGQLAHSYGRGKHIRDKDLEDLALKKYLRNNKGITFSDVVEVFGCSKAKAQRRLKNACIGKIDKNGKKSSILFTLYNERTIPQQYYPSCKKARILENKKNRLIDPTGTNSNNNTSYNPLPNVIGQQIVQSFLTQLYLMPWQPLNIHNIRLWMRIDKNHYEEIDIPPCSDKNKIKIQRDLIGSRVVNYKFHKNGSIEIEIGCSKNPFPIETDNDVNNFFVFLGEVKTTLRLILSDPRERIVPPVDNWILKSCDFNKDVELDGDIGQLMDLNIQIKYAGEAFRLYVKNLEDRFALRGEKVMKVNQPITTFLNDAIMHPNHLINKRLDMITNMIQKLDEKVDANFNRKENT